MAAAAPVVTWGQIRAHATSYSDFSTSVLELQELKAEIDGLMEDGKKVEEDLASCKKKISDTEVTIKKFETKLRSANERGSTKAERYDKELANLRTVVAAEKAELNSLTNKKGLVSRKLAVTNPKFSPSTLAAKIHDREFYKETILKFLNSYRQGKGYVRIMVTADLKAIQFLKELGDNDKELRFAVGKSVDQNEIDPMINLAKDIGIPALKSGCLYELKGSTVRVIPEDEAITVYKFVPDVRVEAAEEGAG